MNNKIKTSYVFVIDLAPYQFESDGACAWICKDFTAFDLKVKSRFSEKYEGKYIERENGDSVFISLTHDRCNDLCLEFTEDGISIEEQAELIEGLFSSYYDGMNEIGYEILDSRSW